MSLAVESGMTLNCSSSTGVRGSVAVAETEGAGSVAASVAIAFVKSSSSSSILLAVLSFQRVDLKSERF